LSIDGEDISREFSDPIKFDSKQKYFSDTVLRVEREFSVEKSIYPVSHF
jgi:hypothetical protein